MASIEQFKRYMLEIKRLRNAPASLKEIRSFLAEASDLQGYDFNISERTFSRDINDIDSLFKIEIQYNNSLRKYEILEDASDKVIDKMIEAFDVFSALNMKERLSNCIHVDLRHSGGTEYLYALLMAVKNQKEVRIRYTKYGESVLSERLIQPYGIKEFRNWWFLLAKDTRDGKLKNFGFDRIREVQTTTKIFEKDPDFDINEYYKYSFGVTVLPDTQPQEVILAIYGEEINYVKAMPFHASQEIIEEKENRLLIKLCMYITWELVAELRSKGTYIEVVSPQELKDKLPDFKYLDQF